MLVSVKEDAGLALGKLEPFLYADIEIFKHLFTHVLHLCADLILQIGLELFKGIVYLGLRAALLIDLPDTPFKIDGVCLTENVVGCAEDVVKQMELILQQIENADVGIIALINEIDNDDVAFLPVTVTAAYSLLDPLRIPRQVIIDDKRTELKVETFRRSFRGDHDLRLVAEVLNERGTLVRRFDAAGLSGVFVAAIPFIVDRV